VDAVNCLGGDVALRGGRPWHVAGLASAGGEETREFHCSECSFFKLRLSGERMRARRLHDSLGIG
jgi:hypothetical protein